MIYVAGFLFSDEGDRVALIHKQRGPAAVVGKWNAIGGKVERGETSLNAMTREFEEEAGVTVEGWAPFLVLDGSGWSVHFYHAFSSTNLANVCQKEDETVSIFPLLSLPEVVSNLQWIIPMAVSHNDQNVSLYTVEETIQSDNKKQD